MNAPLRLLLAVLAAAILTGCATTDGITMIEQERAACAAEGCSVWIEQELGQLARRLFIEGWNAGAKAAGKGV